MEIPAAADVLVEARRNLRHNIQVLIGSGMPRQVLHQLVEESDWQSPEDPTSMNGPLYNGQDVPPRPRMSVASSSSGSSGAASRWSINTHSSMSSAISSSPRSSTLSSNGLPWLTPTISAPATHQQPAQEFSPIVPFSDLSTAMASSPMAITAITASTGSFTVPVVTHPNAVPVGPMVAPSVGPVVSLSSPCTPSLTPTQAKSVNTYACTSCDTTFKRKYDWKRHEDEFHERWKKYPCPEPGCNRSFWGANTFNQHHKQSHGCRTCPHSEQVVRYLRKRKYWACGFCSALHPSRERHVEHVARDFESGNTKAQWMHSRVIYGLLHQPLVHEAWKQQLVAKHAEYGGRTPNFSWDPNKTGRAQGFLEGEVSGKLQDHLEFFSGTEADAQILVRAAYELADVMFVGSPELKASSLHGLPSHAKARHSVQSVQSVQSAHSAHSVRSVQSVHSIHSVHSDTARQSGKRQRQFELPNSTPHLPFVASSLSAATPTMPPSSFGSSQESHGSLAPLVSHPLHSMGEHHEQQQQQQQQQEEDAKYFSPTTYGPPAPYYDAMKSYPSVSERSSLDRKLPLTPPDIEHSPLPHQSHSQTHSQPSQYEYLPTPVSVPVSVPMVMEEWQTYVTTVADGAEQRPSPTVMSTERGLEPSSGQDWHMTDYFNAPRVT